MTHTRSEKPRRFWRRIWDTDPTGQPAIKAVCIRSLRVFHVVVQEVSGGHLTIRAQSLVYTSLLSLVPLLAVSFSVLKGLGIHARYEIVLYYFLEPLGDPGVELSMTLIGFVENAQAGIIGTVGLAFLFYTVFSLVSKVEESLNDIWYEKNKKLCLTRFATYISVILAAPLLVALAAGFAASFREIAVVKSLMERSGLVSVLPVFSKLLFLAIVSASFTLIYAVLPNARVRPVPALTGGIFAGTSWLVTGWLFARFVATSARYSAIYSSFATIILFLIWLYWSFLILLLGAKAAFYTQYPGLHRAVRLKTVGVSDAEACALRTMYILSRNFHEGIPPPGIESLVRNLRMPFELVKDVLAALESRGLVVKVAESSEQTWLPARDAESITVRETLESVGVVGRREARGATTENPVWSLLAESDRIRNEFLDNKTLGQMVRSEGER